jgi:hypothetical protein
MKSSLILAVCVATAFGAMSSCAPRRQQQSLSAQNLFNGRDLSGWNVDVPAADFNVRLRSPFVVRNGMLVSRGEPRGHLLTDSTYRDYRLEIEYRFPATPGNAGVLVHASTPRALYGMFPRSIEVQMESGNAGDFWCILEDIRVPNMARRRGPPAEWGTTEGKARRIRNLTDDSEKPLGEWNTMVIEAVGRSVRVWVNGDMVNDGSDATTDRGRIALQSEGSEVEFRKLSLVQIRWYPEVGPGSKDTTAVVAPFEEPRNTGISAARGRTFKLRDPGQRDSLRATLKKERALWRANNLRDYQFLLRVGCFCPGTKGWLMMDVRGSRLIRASDSAGKSVPLTNWNTLSVDGLFDDLEEKVDIDGVVQVAFDPRWHFPTYVSTVRLPGPDTWGIIEARGFRTIP